MRAFKRDHPLAEPFTIATATWTHATSVFARVEWDGLHGVGEVAPAAHFGDDPNEVVATLERVDLDPLASPFDLEGILELLPAGPARCALDIALHDLAAKAAGVSVAELIGVGGRSLPPTSVTVPIAAPEAMVARARSLADHPVVKVKVGFEGDVGAVGAVRSVYGGRIRVDANEGWSPAQAPRRLEALAAHDVELCEQPVPRGRLEELAAVSAASPIPIYADEDVRTSADVARLAGVVAGVNLKLRKTGGIREALRAVATARALGLGVMLGCDLTTGVAATAEASVAALADHADVDGPLLLADDPHPGVRYDRGRMTLPPGPGLGARWEEG